jgi:hypothetical protein
MDSPTPYRRSKGIAMSKVEAITPERVRRFATYFKNYMGISTIVTAALPIPVTVLNLIPMFESQRRLFSVYTSLFCFLTLAYVFYIRHLLAKVMFRGRFAYSVFPLLPIVGALCCLWLYHTGLQAAIADAKLPEYMKATVTRGGYSFPVTSTTGSTAGQFIATTGTTIQPSPITSTTGTAMSQSPVTSTRGSASGSSAVSTREPHKTTAEVLANVELDEIKGGTPLMFWYLGIFAGAELAFVLMATREYMQDILRLDDQILYEPVTMKA